MPQGVSYGILPLCHRHMSWVWHFVLNFDLWLFAIDALLSSFREHECPCVMRTDSKPGQEKIELWLVAISRMAENCGFCAFRNHGEQNG